MAEERDIKYINKSFSDFKTQLMEYAKNYFPDAYNDFSPTSPGMMFIEMASYVGDVMSFYQDTQLQETFLQHAKNPANLYSLAYMMGYKPKVTSASSVEMTVSQNVTATGLNYKPNWDQALKVQESSVLSATTSNNPTFLTSKPVDFKFSSSYDPTEVQIYSLDENGKPAEYTLTKKVKAYSGTIKSTSKTYTTAEKFATVKVDDTNIIRILDIIDSDGKEWTEVPFLGQDTIFQEVSNTATDSNLAPTLLRLKKVPRRFVTRFTSKGILEIQFGSGIAGSDERDFLPDPFRMQNSIDAGQNSTNELYRSYDPSNFLFTSAYGSAPSETTLTIRYLTGGGVEANVPANSITNIVTAPAEAFSDNTSANTLAFNNTKAAAGGKDGDSTEELRQNSLRSFSEQQRTVTLQDYAIRSLSLPPRFGSIAKVYATQTSGDTQKDGLLSTNPLAISLYTLALDNNGKLVNTPYSLKENLKTYLSQFMMIADGVNILDAFIVNIGINFEVVTLPAASSRDVLLACTVKLKEYFNTNRWSINQPINLSPIYTLLDGVKGIQTVEAIEVINKTGGNYSEFGYDVRGATKSNVVYPSLDPCIFELKFPDVDIQGRVTTL
jgi:hypothetical protein|tara:strand:+ start:10089 stop:11915 length:1827 start_codon:yes stop_codon:yes gene_type:complete